MRISSSQLVYKDMQESFGARSCSSISQDFKNPNITPTPPPPPPLHTHTQKMQREPPSPLLGIRPEILLVFQ